ncbi:transcriptional regulator [Yersinia ruckeri]|uniref:Sensory transducer n=2 Tax=Yersinia ruckeri TaxID=29486 RepID=A0A0A8VCH5_YERRU|nr:winged helix-turn-helix domain-containing protein [Yersinia ruckeri]EEP99176.1 transcriptional regulator [Yersinia ruckeri ATCC 29473]EKN4196946.1 winged helix-turn-helix domain-containing protein [Yersinia ruckeri]EKN4203600.1 winged helix-turn-helix domain-containing protein [Yersinia ruckeri]EKN4700559.1 winged helix-turn-helix domain-containing protein [Yersinia ruckeri]ELI6452667.1 winged helix-turn-helix domain-containing protein [Yersinia ruckeri]
MTKCYNINNSVLFYPESGDIASSLTGNTIKINMPTSQLFEVFITRMGVAVSQNELYTAAWGENSVNVTPNTLYQNISLLRKALQDSGIPSESLKTLRGKGFIFTVASVVEHCVEDIQDVKDSEITPEKSEPTHYGKKTIAYYSMLLTSLIIVFLGVLFYDYKNIPWRVNNYPKDFVFISKINGCSIFNSTEGKSIVNNQKINRLVKTLPAECESYPYVYISYSERHATVSIISCRYDMNYTEQNDCKTEIFINHGELDETQS